jgi:hypothetical protein
MIVWLASFPRSGNSFFRVVCRRLYGLENYSIYPEKHSPVDAATLSRMAEASERYLIKTHEMASDSNPAICLVRDGRDALVSLAWYKLSGSAASNTEISEKDFQKALRNEILSTEFGGWSSNMLSWIRRPEQKVIIRFEDLVKEPEKITSLALGATGFNVNKKRGGDVPSFDELHERNPHLYRKGQVGGWKAQMPPDLEVLFWKKHSEAMDALGYVR